MRWGAIVVAAGRGVRFGRPKQFVEVAGRPLVAWSVELFGKMPEIVELAIATETEYFDAMEVVARTYAPRLATRIVRGGALRQESVRAALEALSCRCDGILVHDGARPLVRASDLRDAMRCVRPGRAALLAAPVVDTIKVVDPHRNVLRTLDRAQLWAAQTPQLATAAEMRRAHVEAARFGTAATDDATLLERIGLDVMVVPSSPDNFKVTHAEDRLRAERLLEQRPASTGVEEEILVVEAFVPPAAAERVSAELARRGGRVDGVERDLPGAAIVRAYVSAGELAGFNAWLAEHACAEAIVTAHFSHVAPRAAAIG